jgi:hypothetical protein
MGPLSRLRRLLHILIPDAVRADALEPAILGWSAGHPGALTPDAPLLQTQLHRQAATLTGVCADLRIAVARPPVAPHDWHGPASRAYAELEDRLRTRLAVAADAAAVALQSTRLALAEGGGGG